MSTVRHLDAERARTSSLRTAEVSGQNVYLSSDSPVPFYVQIAQQLTYLIYSRQLPAGAQLPSVRDLASGLEVTTNTISQAYSELRLAGLADSVKGSGTYVRHGLVTQDDDWHIRNELAAEAVAEVRNRLHALGLDDKDLQHHVMSVLHGTDRSLQIAFAANSALGAEKFAGILETKLEHLGVKATAIDFDELSEPGVETRALLATVYYVVTFVSTAQPLKKLLEPFNRRHRVIGISLELVHETILALAALDPKAKVAIVTTERYFDISLNVVQSNSRLDPSNITRMRSDEAPEVLARKTAAADRVIYTFGASPEVEDLGIPEERRLLIGFTIDAPSLNNLATILAPRGAR